MRQLECRRTPAPASGKRACAKRQSASSAAPAPHGPRSDCARSAIFRACAFRLARLARNSAARRSARAEPILAVLLLPGSDLGFRLAKSRTPARRRASTDKAGNRPHVQLSRFARNSQRNRCVPPTLRLDGKDWIGRGEDRGAPFPVDQTIADTANADHACHAAAYSVAERRVHLPSPQDAGDVVERRGRSCGVDASRGHPYKPPHPVTGCSERRWARSAPP